MPAVVRNPHSQRKPELDDMENSLNFKILTTNKTKSAKGQIRLLFDYLVQHAEDAAYGRENDLFRVIFGIPPFVDLDTNVVDDPSGTVPDWSLNSLLSVSNCIVVRKAAARASLFQLVSSCDNFIASNFSNMLNEREILSLPRLQVNVNVHENSQDLWSSDTFVLERILPVLVRKLQQLSTSPRKAHVLEEKIFEVNLLSDLSVEMANAKKFTSYLCPEKHMSKYINLSKRKPSTFRKLHLGTNQEFEDFNKSAHSKPTKNWSVVASRNVSASAAVCVVSPGPSEGLIVLNIQLVADSPDAICPISPTTGVPLSTGSTLLLQMTKARCGFGMVAVGNSLLSMGGFNRSGVLSGIECFHGDVNSWSPNGRLSCTRARMCTVKWEDTIYAIGGSDGKSELYSMEELRLSSSSKEWKVLPARLSTPRSDFGAAVLCGQIYVVGGTFYSNVLRSAEVFNIQGNRWRPVAPMTTPRNGVSVVACNGKIFALGGQQSSWHCLNTVESYDPSTNQWTQVAPMVTARRNACAATVEGCIYVMGGYNGVSAVDTVEIYDPIINEWSIGKPMTRKRSGASAVVMGEAVYVVGGYTGLSFLNSIEKYDLEREEWTNFVVYS